MHEHERHKRPTFQDEALAAIGKLDDEVRSCIPPEFPEIAKHAVAFAASIMASGESPTSQIEGFVVICKQIYRLGYRDGKQDLQTQLTPSGNRG